MVNTKQVFHFNCVRINEVPDQYPTNSVKYGRLAEHYLYMYTHQW